MVALLVNVQRHPSFECLLLHMRHAPIAAGDVVSFDVYADEDVARAGIIETCEIVRIYMFI